MSARGSSGAPARRGWGLSARVSALVLVSIAISVAASAYVTYRAFSGYATTRAGRELQSYGAEVLEGAGQLITGHVLGLQALATSPDIVSSVREANAENARADATELDAWIAKTDKAWIGKDPSVADLVESVMKNPVSDHLTTFKTALPGELEVFVTDAKGLALAETDRTSDYLQGDEGWWKSAWADGAGKVFVDQVEYDESTGAWAMNIAVPVRGGDGKAVGVLRGTVDISVLVKSLEKIRIGNTGTVGLLGADGNVIYAADEKLRQKPAPASVATLAKEAQGAVRVGIADLDGKNSVVATSKLEGGLAADLGWTLIAQQPLAEVQAPAVAASRNSIMIALLVAAVLGGVALLAGSRMTGPLRKTAEAARALGEGDTGTARELVASFAARRDEVGELSHAFADLTDCTSAVAAAARSVSEGDLTVGVVARGEKDELSLAVGEMVVQMRALVGQVAGSVRQLTDGINQVDSAMEQVARSAMSQTTSVENATNSMERLVAGVADVAAGAREQARAVALCSSSVERIAEGLAEVLGVAREGTSAAQTASEQARAAAGIVRATVSGMADIRDGTALAADRVREMGERSNEIGEIIGTIENIASQTNLLALNAAIEAARAGEHGRGFAVVADEVRKLAEGASSAAREIGSLIHTIRQTIVQAMEAMDTGSAEVEKGMAQAEEASGAIEEILVAVDGLARRVQGISTSAEAMASGSRDLTAAMAAVSSVVERYTTTTGTMEGETAEITDLMGGIVAVSEENSAAAQEVAATADALRVMAGDVSGLVGRFRLS
jgi:methyl-accepting chemotaxis protein